MLAMYLQYMKIFKREYDCKLESISKVNEFFNKILDFKLLDSNDFAKLDLLSAFLNETLRLYPPGTSVFPRISE